MYALVEIKGKQYKVAEGDVLAVDKLKQKEGESLDFETVLLTGGDGEVKVGTPYLKGTKVSAVVEAHGRDKKVLVRKFKRRKGYHRTQGHRQGFSRIKVTGISGA